MTRDEQIEALKRVKVYVDDDPTPHLLNGHHGHVSKPGDPAPVLRLTLANEGVDLPGLILADDDGTPRLSWARSGPFEKELVVAEIRAGQKTQFYLRGDAYSFSTQSTLRTTIVLPATTLSLARIHGVL